MMCVFFIFKNSALICICCAVAGVFIGYFTCFKRGLSQSERIAGTSCFTRSTLFTIPFSTLWVVSRDVPELDSLAFYTDTACQWLQLKTICLYKYSHALLLAVHNYCNKLASTMRRELKVLCVSVGLSCEIHSYCNRRVINTNESPIDFI